MFNDNGQSRFYGHKYSICQLCLWHRSVLYGLYFEYYHSFTHNYFLQLSLLLTTTYLFCSLSFGVLHLHWICSKLDLIIEEIRKRNDVHAYNVCTTMKISAISNENEILWERHYVITIDISIQIFRKRNIVLSHGNWNIVLSHGNWNW